MTTADDVELWMKLRGSSIAIAITQATSVIKNATTAGPRKNALADTGCDDDHSSPPDHSTPNRGGTR